MSERPAYTEFHPRWYRPRMSTWWWLGRPAHLLFILRELSSVFVAWSAVYLLLLVAAVDRGDAAYAAFLERATRPGMLLLNLVALFFVVLHAVTWFNLAPQALAVRLHGRRVPGRWIAAAHFAAWAAASGVIAWLLLGGE